MALHAQQGRLAGHRSRQSLQVNATATLTRSVPHIGRASELPKRTVSSPAPPAPLAFEVIKGNLVRFSSDAQSKNVPTAVLVHGILGSRRNLHSFAHMIVEGFPSWQVMLVDLRCHGESSVSAGGVPAVGPHTVQTAARDVLALLREQRMFPHMLVGHSFGGKVVMSMAQQFGAQLPRPVQAWVLDTLPGEVRAGGPGRADHPADLIAALRRIPLPIADRNGVMDYLLASGFSTPIARWVLTNLRPNPGGVGLRWTFDLEGIAEMYDSYEDTCLWGLLQQPPQGLAVDFVRAERSNFRWEGGIADSIQQLGHRVHLLKDAGHWVHADNPGGLFDIMGSSFGVVDLHLERAQAGTRRR
ncbi:hypothetical protein OEZ86_000612 [Tetradesmus obliquus]|uniref:Uncharacterized protein n=2 Tax=Tetradesmus obliquus TaxID=3088 RepID=A0ABY8TN06_TETOB|nr:hypothetical protein OEZ85_010670 [Tetradesmus obliquus]WIA30528.1 hypothetical protein OEZ86_000612 [Tetradesmus obliquus]|eukprot:jgi/Sobl393_1/1594/SZX78554.1